MSLPKVFEEVGFLLGSLFIMILSIFAYITSTFVVESNSIVNALFDKHQSLNSDADEVDIITKLMVKNQQPFHLNRRIEYSKLSDVLFPPFLRLLFSTIFLLYFLLDLVVYATGVPVAVVQIFGDSVSVFGFTFTGMNLHRLIIVVFGLIITPLSLADYQKTKVLQRITLVLRICAFYTMIYLGFVFIFRGEGTPREHIPVFKWKKLPLLFGGTTYSMMCHHSLASTITPLKDHKDASTVLRRAFALMATSYVLLCSSAVFAFSSPHLPDHCDNTPGVPCRIQTLYLQNFASYDHPFVSWMLLLFPLFIFITLYPLIVMTLRNNLEQFLPFKPDSKLSRPFCNAFSLVVPLSIGLMTTSLKTVISLVGTFAGSWIMLGFPCLFVLYARRRARLEFPSSFRFNTLGSSFESKFWVFLVLGFFSVVFGVNLVRVLTGSFFE
ncbi:hypothetical protein P9112_000309 [Eukaryota sp. TZLM1-RC]